MNHDTSHDPLITGIQLNDSVSPNVSVGGSNNPWDDVPPVAHRASHSISPGLQRRLSFDHASGVIMLPDEDDWLEEEEDSDADYGTASAILEKHGTDPVTPTPAPAMPLPESGPSSPLEERNLMPVSPARSSRYGTYFHHPERRRQPIPGAFPTTRS